jgi:hypothetical protein
VIKFELLNVNDLTFATLIKSTLTWLAIEALPPLPTIYVVLLVFIFFFINSTLSSIKLVSIEFSKSEIDLE